MSLFSAKQAMEEVARKHGVTYEEVYHEIEAAIAEAMGTKNGRACEIWAAIPRRGSVPTPIELIEFLRDHCVV